MTFFFACLFVYVDTDHIHGMHGKFVHIYSHVLILCSQGPFATNHSLFVSTFLGLRQLSLSLKHQIRQLPLVPYRT